MQSSYIQGLHFVYVNNTSTTIGGAKYVLNECAKKYAMCVLGLGDMSKNSYLCIFWLICGIRYISLYLYTFVFGLNK